jgi:lipopolysaccharide transport system permease protein
MEREPKWEWEINAEQRWYSLRLGELLHYKDLLFSFFRRELLSGYHQSVIGVFWIILQPLLTTLFYFIVFNRIVKVSTDHIPPVLFYMLGSIIWSFFSDCLSGVMNSFLHNAHIFSKIYFPRLVVPLSMVLNHALRFGIQFVLFIITYILYSVFYIHVSPSVYVIFVPLLILQAAAFALGIGLILSVYVAKYRDVEHMTGFLLRLFMFVTPVFFPTSIIPENYRMLLWLNPLTSVIESFRTIFFNNGPLQTNYILVSMITSFLILSIGVILFKHKEIKIMDTI